MEGERTARGSKHFANFLFGWIGLRGWFAAVGGIPGDNFLTARLSVANHIADREVTAANELFGGRLAARRRGESRPN